MNLLIISDIEWVKKYILHNTLGEINCILPDKNYLNPVNLNDFEFYINKYNTNVVVRLVNNIGINELDVISNLKKIKNKNIKVLYINVSNDNDVGFNSLLNNNYISYHKIYSTNDNRLGDTIINILKSIHI